MSESSSSSQEQVNMGLKSGFVAGTLVHTREGLKAIEEVRVGDWVMTNAHDAIRVSTQVDVGEPIYHQVLETYITEDSPIGEIRYVQPDGEYGFLCVALHHPIMIKGKGYMLAGELKYGHPLMLGYFGTVLVGKNKPLIETARVYDVKVSETHTYFVGKYGVWVASV
jgi:hypothetical protein